MKVAVLGGGIAGLAAAFRLEKLVGNAEIVLVERDDRLGGKIATDRVDGFVLERAPDSFLSRKERGIALCEELGLTGELVGRRPEFARTFVRRGSELLPLPAGLTGTIPTDLDALEGSALLSPEGRARLAREADLPPAVGAEDESIASFVTRRFGSEAYEALVEPLMTGIYGGDGAALSLAATFPQLRALELEHGSVLRGLATRPSAPGSFPPFVSLRSGMGALVTGLAARLERTRALTGVAARSVDRSVRGYVLRLEGGSTLEAEAVVVALPAYAAAEVLARLDPELAGLHAGIPYGSSVLVTLAFASVDVARPVDGYGYLVPRSEGSDVLACTWTSHKWAGRAPDGAHLVRVYAGRFGERDLTEEQDDDLVLLARSELAVAGVDARPLFARVQRWPLGMPQYVLGHPDRLERIETAARAHPGLVLAGAAYRGVGIPDSIRSGEEAAETVARSLAAATA